MGLDSVQQKMPSLKYQKMPLVQVSLSSVAAYRRLNAWWVRDDVFERARRVYQMKHFCISDGNKGEDEVSKFRTHMKLIDVAKGTKTSKLGCNSSLYFNQERGDMGLCGVLVGSLWQYIKCIWSDDLGVGMGIPICNADNSTKTKAHDRLHYLNKVY